MSGLEPVANTQVRVHFEGWIRGSSHDLSHAIARLQAERGRVAIACWPQHADHEAKTEPTSPREMWGGSGLPGTPLAQAWLVKNPGQMSLRLSERDPRLLLPARALDQVVSICTGGTPVRSVNPSGVESLSTSRSIHAWLYR